MKAKQLFELWAQETFGKQPAYEKRVSLYADNPLKVTPSNRTYADKVVEKAWLNWQIARNWFLSYGNFALQVLANSPPELIDEVKHDFIKLQYYEYRCTETGRNLQQEPTVNAMGKSGRTFSIWLAVAEYLLTGVME